MKTDNSRKSKFQKKLILGAAGLLSIFLLSGCGNEKKEENKESTTTQETESGDELLSGMHHVNINIKDMGTISVELDADSAPITVTNFINLAESGFYDGLTFHRIINGFMMQGGASLGDDGVLVYTIKGEFSSNRVENPLTHTRGAISMARAKHYDSASSQFFIMHQDDFGLDGDYAVFGYVTDGMDIVDYICENTTGQDINGVVAAENRPIIESIEVID